MDLYEFQNSLMNIMKPYLKKIREGRKRKKNVLSLCPLLIFEVWLSFRDLFSLCPVLAR